MVYNILINYDTGDSFHRETNLETLLDRYDEKANKMEILRLENLKIAKENLKRIQEHYIAFLDTASFGRLHFSKSELKQKEEDVKKMDWYGFDPVWKCWQSFIYLLNDNREKILFSTNTWTGYFNSLNWAEVVPETPEDSGMRISF